MVYANHCFYLFYIVGDYILSGNSKDVVVYINHCIYMFYLVGVYILSGYPEHVVLGDDVTVTITCVRDDSSKLLLWTKNSLTIGSFRDECVLTAIPDNRYNYTCDVANNIYYLIIPPDAITDGIQNVSWRCNPAYGPGSNPWNLTLSGTYGVCW